MATSKKPQDSGAPRRPGRPAGPTSPKSGKKPASPGGTPPAKNRQAAQRKAPSGPAKPAAGKKPPARKTSPSSASPVTPKKTGGSQPAVPSWPTLEGIGVRPTAEREADRSTGRDWKKILLRVSIVLGPSLLFLLMVLVFPQILGNSPSGREKATPAEPSPMNLLPSPHDAVYHSPTIFLSNQVIAYYGHPLARFMGIVGRHPMRELGPILRQTAKRYDALNGPKGMIPAFYLIYGTAQPGGNIITMTSNLLGPYIHYTATNGFLLILDHQIGKYGPRHAINTLLPFLRYPHVHLAIDPEWRTTRPMREIGQVSGEELNEAQAMMRSYMVTNRIPGKRMLIVHQFENKMIQRRERVRAIYDPVVLVHSISGWGTPSMKLSTYQRHSVATNMPVKGFKLWYDPGIRRPGLHYDAPLMPPQQVLGLKPEPMLIMYQ